MSDVDEGVEQTTLLDLDTKKFNPYWVDEKQPGIIPKNPLHYKAHKLQILLARLDKQAASNPAQFNSKNYIDALNEWSRVTELINKGAQTDEQATTDNDRSVDDVPERAAPTLGKPRPVGVGAGVSPKDTLPW